MQQGRIFHLKLVAVSALMPGDVLVMEKVFNFYITITETILYRIQSSSKTYAFNELT